MRYVLPLLGLTGILTIAGCSTSSPFGSGKAGADAPRPVQQCNAQNAQWAVGKTNTEHNINEARKRAGAYMARVIKPGQPMTRDYNMERLNLEVDATGRIVKAFCG